MPNTHRLEMVARELLREISKIVNYEMQNPRIGMVTVTKVTPAPDMKTAKVFVSTMAEGKARELSLQGLSDARNFIRAQLRARMKGVRYIPELTFKFDESIAGAIRISKLIDQVTKERAEKGEPAGEAEKGGDV